MDNDKIFYIHSKCCNAHWEQVYNADKKEIVFVCEKCGQVGLKVDKVDLGTNKCDNPDCTHDKHGKITGSTLIKFVVKSKNPEEEGEGTLTGSLNSWEHLVATVAYWEKKGKAVEFSVVKGGNNG